MAPAAAPAPAPPSSLAAGLTLVGVLGVGAVGAVVAGPVGAGAGLLLAGGARNAYVAARDVSSEDKMVRYEATKAGMLGLVELAVAAWLAYAAVKEAR